MRRASQLVSPLRLPRLSRLHAPAADRDLAHAQLAAGERASWTASRSRTVQHDRAARQALELRRQPADGHVAAFAVDGERLGGDAARRLVVLKSADHLAQPHRLEWIVRRPG